MGKENRKKKKQSGYKSGEASVKQHKIESSSPEAYDEDTTIFVSMSRELKDEGNKLFQKRDHQGAMLKYEKALKLLPNTHIDIPCLRSNMAACYMQMGLSEYPRAISECSLALEVTPTYSKALLKRARCYEALNRLDLALRDVVTVLNIEPNNIMASEIAERIKSTLEKNGLKVNNATIELPHYYIEPLCTLPPKKALKERSQKKKRNKIEAKKSKEILREKEIEEIIEEKEEEITRIQDEVPKKTVKLVFEDDIRWAQLPVNSTLLQLRKVIHDRFPNSRAVLIKYKDGEGDLVTITTDEELRWAEKSAESQSSVRLYIVEVNPEKDQFFEKFKNDQEICVTMGQNDVVENGNLTRGKEIQWSSCIEDWMIQFAQLFQNHVGFESDKYLDLHELGIKLFSEAIEETVTSDEAQDIFDRAAEKFCEMAVLSLFNWGNVHMSRAKKRVYFIEDESKESVDEQIKSAYDWAQEEYMKAGKRYEQAVEMKPDFFEGFLALGEQQFQQAKLSWYYGIASNVDLETWPYTEVLPLYNNAEDNMEKGMQIWMEWEEQRENEISKPSSSKTQMQKMGLDGLLKDLALDETEEQAKLMSSRINLLWGTILYERSIIEFKLKRTVWHECLKVAVEKFELAGVSSSDIAVLITNHCSNSNAPEGLRFKIDEIVEAWNEMYEAKKFESGVPSFRLEPLFRRRVSKLNRFIEQA